MSAIETILVVDDNRQNRTILKNILKQGGYNVLEAENGREALEIVNDGRQAVSLMLLDIVMPVMNGYEVLESMNRSGLISSLPVIIMTSNGDSEAEIRCLENGASDFIRSPYNPELVCYRIRSILRLRENTALICRLENDHLTQVYSREFFYRRAMARMNEHPEASYCVIYTDIDDFKMINARYGTRIGDELLKYLAGIFNGWAGEDGVCGRIGGDTFAILLKDWPTLTQEQVGKLYHKIFADAPVKGFQVKCGIYPVTDLSLKASDMCDRAKIAVDSIKKKYGQYYAVYNDSMRQKAIREHLLAGRMEEALKNGEFVVYLQPKHCTDSGAVSGAEALVRWNHPELGFLSPGEFVPLFERSGFIAKLDYFVWSRVCGILSYWIDRGINPIPISVNASRADFVSPELAEKIESLVDSYGLPHELLHVEVTESTYTDNPGQMIAAVSKLRDMGFLIEMDDFGSGYSSLNMLSELPIDILKLDMRFMQTNNDRIKGGKRNILSFTMGLSKWLQLATVAESVETEEEYELLKAMGCNMIQGYFFAKPMPVDEFEEYMKAHPEICKKSRKAVPAAKVPVKPVSEEEKPLVLVAEDIESNREMMRELLKPCYKVAAVENGKEACAYLLSHREEISCVLLDLLMPVMDGFQVLKMMQSDGMIDEIPVIITTETGSDSELRALHLGADGFVAKPYNPEILLHTVKKSTEEKRFWQIKREFEKQSRDLYNKAYRDELTNLYNRYGLKEALDSLPENESCAMLMLDIDNLKQFNDAKGHVVGDKLIRTIAGVMNDTVGEDDVIARIGGDEFVVILRKAEDKASALFRGEELCRAIREADISDMETELRPSCSAGITMVNQPESFESAYKRADEALYLAKRTKKGSCFMWENRPTEDKPGAVGEL